MKVVHYTVDIKSLLAIQDQESKERADEVISKKKQFNKNKLKLLKIILPLVHGIVAIHNHKCDNWTKFGGKQLGLIGYGKADLDEVISNFTEEDFNFTDQGNTVKIDLISEHKFKVWLNSEFKHNSGQHPLYSMTTIGGGEYGTTIEDELIKIARYAAKFEDEWTADNSK